MRARTKLTLAAGFLGAVATAAAAFGQVGTGERPEGERRSPDRAAASHDRCPDRAGRRAARLVHAESKLRAREGFAVVVVDHGRVVRVDHAAKRITIERADGERVSGIAVEETVVCRDGEPAAFDAIRVGDSARLVHVRSERFTGLRRIVARSPGAEPEAPEEGAAPGSS